MANTNRNIDNMSPFITFCQHVIPLSYDESLSYYETLCALRNYVGQMVEAVNNNADAVTELQNKFTELQNYVDNYFKNLDVQEEINTKLDEMATDGTLENIINEQIFGEINDKIDNNYNDLNGKIQTNTESIQTNTSNIETNKQSIETNASNIEKNTEAINQINEKLKVTNKYIAVIGDSWTDPNNTADRDGGKDWATLMQPLVKETIINKASSGGGFSLDKRFDTQMQEIIDDEDVPNEDITMIIIYGGVNDMDRSNYTNLKNGCISLLDLIARNCPNAKTYLCFYNHPNRGIKKSDIDAVVNLSQDVKDYDVTFVKAGGFCLGDGTFASNKYHPNQKGSEQILRCMMCLYNGQSQGFDVGIIVNDPRVSYPSYTSVGKAVSNIYYNPFLGRLHGQCEISAISYNLNTDGDYQLDLDIGMYQGFENMIIPQSCAIDAQSRQTTQYADLGYNNFTTFHWHITNFLSNHALYGVYGYIDITYF